MSGQYDYIAAMVWPIKPSPDAQQADKTDLQKSDTVWFLCVDSLVGNFNPIRDYTPGAFVAEMLGEYVRAWRKVMPPLFWR